MKFCKDCANLGGTGAIEGTCLAPEAVEFSNRVTGEPPSASWMRDDPYPVPNAGKGPPRCGPKAAWFKAKESVA